MNNLTDQIHSLGLKAGIVRHFETRNEQSAHIFDSTATLVGSLASFTQVPSRTKLGLWQNNKLLAVYLLIVNLRDVKLFQDWGFDYLKYT
jgi:hypothetical protein